MVLMVYGATRRTGVYMMQDVFRRLGVAATREDVAFARSVISAVPTHFVRHYTSVAVEDLASDAGFVDTFLHPCDRAYTVPQVLALVRDSGLEFQGWFDNQTYYPDAAVPQGNPLWTRLAALPEHEQWAVVEMLTCTLGSHIFVARHIGQAQQLSFADEWRCIVPHRRPEVVQLTDTRFQRDGAVFELTSEHARWLAFADGKTPIRDEAQRGFFAAMWRRGHIMASRRR